LENLKWENFSVFITMIPNARTVSYNIIYP
jgi:hypothetical protein